MTAIKANAARPHPARRSISILWRSRLTETFSLIVFVQYSTPHALGVKLKLKLPRRVARNAPTHHELVVSEAVSLMRALI